ncbi:MAG TPA: GxxExxY protein [Candidatus Thermoplasmatota archaeon]|nr:GxxExxY protein [Candidatus Thermoplasmatota archaeon]
MPVPPMRRGDIPDELNRISGHVLDGAIEVHRTLGRELSESTYQVCLKHELELRGFRVEMERRLPLVYKDLLVPDAYRADLLVEDKVIVELKCVEKLLPAHEAQLMNYLHSSGCRLGMILNFRAPLIKEDFRRRVL